MSHQTNFKPEKVMDTVRRHLKRRKGPTAKRRASKRATANRAARAVYAAVDARDGLKSRLSGKGGHIHRHHIIFRSRGGLTTTSNVITVTDEEHTDIHAHKISLCGDADVIGGVRVIVKGETVSAWLRNV